jgi:hypothetical protein
MQENTQGYVCSWCGGEVEKIRPPDYPGEQMMGICGNDGVVYVENPQR